MSARYGYGEARDYLKRKLPTIETDHCIHWPFLRTAKGYGVLGSPGEFGTRFAHRIVCISRHGEPVGSKTHAAHECGNAGCVNYRHLKWKTAKENIADKNKHGTAQRGERSTSAKLTKREVKAIIALKGRMSQTEIASIFEVHQSNVSLIHSGRTWS